MFYIHFDAKKYQARKAMQETLFWIFGMNTEF